LSKLLNPLEKLISERNFDRFQSGLKARFAAYRLEYTLTYSEPNDKSSMSLDFDSEQHIGRVTVWVSGECDMEILDVSTGKQVFYEHHQFNNELDFHRTYPRLVVFMRDALGWTSNDD
jgi:hypothetical protein